MFPYQYLLRLFFQSPSSRLRTSFYPILLDNICDVKSIEQLIFVIIREGGGGVEGIRRFFNCNCSCVTYLL